MSVSEIVVVLLCVILIVGVIILFLPTHWVTCSPGVNAGASQFNTAATATAP